MRKAQKVSLFLIVCISIFSVLFTNLYNSNLQFRHHYFENSNSNNINILTSFNSNNFSIEINSDDDLLTYSFPGTGNYTDPYRIENFSFTTSQSYGIKIYNTTKHILIQNCNINAQSDAINVRKTAPDTIIINNNTLSGSLGIYIDNSSHIRITNNKCIETTWISIILNNAPYSLIANNTLIGNTLLGKSGIAIKIEFGSHYSQIINNKIINNNDGILLHHVSGCTIKNNILRNNRLGILLDGFNREQSSSNLTITDNLFENNSWYGLLILNYNHNNVVYHNSFVNNNPNGKSQAKDDGENNIWFNTTLKEGNYWSDWWGILPYPIDGSANKNDMYPLESPLHPTITKIPTFFIGRVVLVIALSIGIPVFLTITILIIKKFKKKRV